MPTFVQRFSPALLALFLVSGCSSPLDRTGGAIEVPDADCGAPARAGRVELLTDIRGAVGRDHPWKSESLFPIFASATAVDFTVLTPITRCFVDLDVGAGWVDLFDGTVTPEMISVMLTRSRRKLNAATGWGADTAVEAHIMAGLIDPGVTDARYHAEFEGRDGDVVIDEVPRPLLVSSVTVAGGPTETFVRSLGPQPPDPPAAINIASVPRGNLTSQPGPTFTRFSSANTLARNSAAAAPTARGVSSFVRTTSSVNASTREENATVHVPVPGALASRTTPIYTELPVTSSTFPFEPPYQYQPFSTSVSVRLRLWVYMPTLDDLEVYLRGYRGLRSGESVEHQQTGRIRVLEPGIYFADVTR